MEICSESFGQRVSCAAAEAALDGLARDQGRGRKGHILHANVTAHPYAEWAARQIVAAVGRDTSIARLIRDRDGIYGTKFDARVNHLGIR